MNIVEAIRSLNQPESRFMDTTLQFVRSEQNDTLADIAKIHLISAEQAFISATRSNNPESEARVGIGHLRDAFNAFQIYLDKGAKCMWGLYYLKWSDEPRTDIELKLASIAIVIALIYKRLDDESNYLLWKNTGFDFATRYIKARPDAIRWWWSATTVTGKSADWSKQNAYPIAMKFIESFSDEIKNI